jgi:hypothetical protein
MSDLSSELRLLVTANIVPNYPILDALMVEAVRSSDTSVLAKATNVPEDGILHSDRRDNHKSYITVIVLSSVTEATRPAHTGGNAADRNTAVAPGTLQCLQ